MGIERMTPYEDHLSCDDRRFSRRALIHGSSLFLAGAGLTGPGLAWLLAEDRTGAKPAARVGVLTDIHFADKPPAGTRHYRESLDKLREAVARFQEEKVDFAVELGDLIDSARSPELELKHLAAVEAEYSRFKGPRHYVLGNHCLDGLTRKQFFENCGASRPYYSFDHADFHFIVLDACHRADGEPYSAGNFQWTDSAIPIDELKWLEADLQETDKHALVFVHQRLDVANSHGIRNAPAVREVLEKSGKVLAVLQGHSHKNDLRQIGGIPYCTLAAVIEGSGAENNAYGVLELFADGSARIDGFRQQMDVALKERSE